MILAIPNADEAKPGKLVAMDKLMD
ncbi:hypothetical protein AvCA_21040 [Azotobacter vinelandii CA]|uniref:Uncharacterized protein n=2 Tax=Azotobacter vinelandii TaxID=354 RepID=C1DFA2_AZOVD|nr:hypothetical protein Avin_21040 [Azotobacter vinelandii DJ]AGK16787.1 hypothetical protein AvCA_21040 [Azotobacter vinelandii CA]AGK20399.1 hypothetical protein AvCA6_21040 [Azotobacter vinelandii CA6]